MRLMDRSRELVPETRSSARYKDKLEEEARVTTDEEQVLRGG